MAGPESHPLEPASGQKACVLNGLQGREKSELVFLFPGKKFGREVLRGGEIPGMEWLKFHRARTTNKLDCGHEPQTRSSPVNAKP